MTTIEALTALSPELTHGIIIIDRDTGSVLGTNLVACLIPDEDATPGALEDILSSDSAAFDYAEQNGHPLFIVLED